jgi:hypothetical protein
LLIAVPPRNALLAGADLGVAPENGGGGNPGPAELLEKLRGLGEEAAQAFERRLKVATLLVAGTFFFSSTMNFILARWIVTSPAGSVAFTRPFSGPSSPTTNVAKRCSTPLASSV